MKKRIFSALICLCLVAGMLSPAALAINPDQTHPVCGASHSDVGDHTGTCGNLTFQPWDGSNIDDITYTDGVASVYLTQDNSTHDELSIPAGCTLNLCLNGKILDSLNIHNYFLLNENSTLNICDCAGGGALASDRSSVIELDFTSSVVNVYGGTIYSSSPSGRGLYIGGSGDINIYGGTVTSVNDSAIFHNTNSTVSVHGGTLTGKLAGLEGYGSVVVTGGTISSTDSHAIHNMHNTYVGGDSVVTLSNSPVLNSNASAANILLTDLAYLAIGTGGLTNSTPYTVSTNTTPPVAVSTTVDDTQAAAFLTKFASFDNSYVLFHDTDAQVIKLAPTHTVSFDVMGHGDPIADLPDVPSGSKITAPAAPTADGWVFGGWYKENTCTNAWNFDSDTVTGTTTLYAKWTLAMAVNSTTDVSYGTAAAALAAANSGETVTLLTGCGEDITIPAGVTFSTGGYTQSGNVTNNGTVSGGIFTGLVTNNGTIEGGNFDHEGGYPADVVNNGTIDGGLFDGRVQNTGTVAAGTFYATVDNEGGTIQGVAFFSSDAGVNNDGGTIKGGIFHGSVNNDPYGDAASLIQNGTFYGLVENGANGTITGGDFSNMTGNPAVANYGLISGGTYAGKVNSLGGSTVAGATFHGDVTFYGGSTVAGGTYKNPVNIRGEAGGTVTVTAGEFEGSEAGILYHFGVLDLSGVDPDTFSVTVRSTYADGWGAENDIPVGSDVSGSNRIVLHSAQAAYRNSTEVSNLNESNAQATLIGKLAASTPTYYTVTFHTQGTGTATTPDPIENVPAGSTIDEPDQPYANYYAFMGWYKEAACVNEWNFAADTVSANTTLYAKWEDAAPSTTTYTVTFDANGHGTAPDPLATVPSGFTIEEPDEPTATGYEFKGWFKEALCAIQWLFDKDRVFEDTTLYAKWEDAPVTYTVSFNLQGHGAAIEDIENVTAGSTIDEPDEPTADGYAFMGWYKEAACTNEWNFAADTVSANTTLYAKWEENTLPGGPGNPVVIHTVIFMNGDEEWACTTCEHGETLGIVGMPIPEIPEGYEFAGWYTEDDVHVHHGMTVEEDLIAYATWEEIEDDEPDYETYRIKIEAGEGGKTSPKRRIYVREGYDKKITITPDDGYVIERVLVDGKNKGAISEYLFENLDDDHTVEVTFRKLCSGTAKDDCPSLYYSDLSATQWYHDAVDYVLETGIMVGYDGHFEPYGTLTRAQVATILWRLEGCPLTYTALPYADVSAGHWSAEAVRWATYTGIVEGWNGHFNPDAPITHEQLVTILYRYSCHKQLTLGVAAGREAFLSYPDAGQVSPYAVDAMQWACHRGLLDFTDTLAPQQSAQRCETAQLLTNFLRG